MNTIEKLTLIEGEFSFDEAKEILNSIFSSKINFHNMKNWSSQERFGEDDAIAQKRIPALRNEMKKLYAILSEAKAKNKNLLVSSEISYTYTCQKCTYKKEEKFPNGKHTEDPMYCDFCNP